ncbi:MAG: DUF2842 domain-containing protein [Paracoccaceae bacterium]|jgi:hypothetical protein|nr:DUF2842 domain-containing protein [Paracoccaceae bacterium]
MKINYKTRRKLSLLILLVGIPCYAAFVVTLMEFLVNLPTFVELLIYVFFGIVWVFPVKFVFRGIGQSDPDDY